MRRAIAAALLAAAVALGACGGNDHKASSTSTSTAAKPPPAKPAPADIAPGGGLAIGMTEINPDLFWHGKDVGAFTPWRDRFEALKPPLYRLVVDWSSLQPKQGGPIDWSKASDGCMRGLQPCRPYNGIRDTLRAIRSQQQAGNGFATMVVVYGVPDWAAVAAHGCERPGIAARSRPINAVPGACKLCWAVIANPGGKRYHPIVYVPTPRRSAAYGVCECGQRTSVVTAG